MTVYLTLISTHDLVLTLVSDFARGLGCAVDVVPAPAGRGIRIEVPDLGHSLVELLTHVALSATKAGVDVTEPLCQVTYRHGGVSSEVVLALRIAAFRIDTAAAPRA
ncbi:MAG TPA: hypothetical protein VIK60_12080 [Vicinamibacterales bacterium]